MRLVFLTPILQIQENWIFKRLTSLSNIIQLITLGVEFKHKSLLLWNLCFLHKMIKKNHPKSHQMITVITSFWQLLCHLIILNTSLIFFFLVIKISIQLEMFWTTSFLLLWNSYLIIFKLKNIIHFSPLWKRTSGHWFLAFIQENSTLIC